ncbi:hypothetical protein Esti_006752 [Eimeria stiedai]
MELLQGTETLGSEGASAPAAAMARSNATLAGSAAPPASVGLVLPPGARGDRQRQRQRDRDKQIQESRGDSETASTQTNRQGAYGWVLVIVLLAVCLSVFLTFNVIRARVRFGVKPPDFYAVKGNTPAASSSSSTMHDSSSSKRSVAAVAHGNAGARLSEQEQQHRLQQQQQQRVTGRAGGRAEDSDETLLRLSARECDVFNCYQRAHQHAVEGFSVFLPLLLAGGLGFPRLSALGGLLFVLGNLAYALGYYTADP